MPKQKIKASIKKRFRITKTGKVLAGRSFNRHLARKKSSARKRRLAILKNYDGKIGKKIKLLLGAA